MEFQKTEEDQYGIIYIEISRVVEEGISIHTVWNDFNNHSIINSISS